MRELALQARAAARILRTLGTKEKNDCLQAMADALRANRESIEKANAEDRKADLPAAKLDRLKFDVEAVAKSIEAIAALPDPVGREEERKHDNAFHLVRRRVPLGVIMMIFESRPNVTPEAGALCLKSGNAALLRGGSEARFTNEAVLKALQGTFPENAIQLVPGGHEVVGEMLVMDDLIDLVIPRGGEGLIRAVSEQSRIPVLKHYRGNCHLYVDADAVLDMAWAITENAKLQRPATCNALEKVIVHEKVAADFIPRLKDLNVELRGDEKARAVLDMKPAVEADWPEEYLDLVLGVRVVSDLQEAVDHIDRYGSGHTDAIVTGNEATAKSFLDQVDSSTVMWNASTRLADGGVFGLGAEVGIATDKLHARGPMGIEELTTYKWVIEGTGDIRP